MNRKRLFSVTAVAALALSVAACGGNGGTEDTSGGSDTSASEAGGEGSGEQITLTVATFNEFGYEDLYEQYMEENPNIKIEPIKAATSDEARQNLLTGLAAGDGLADVEAAEVGWFTELMPYADKFVDLANEDVAGRWLDWKEQAATTPEGQLLGYGTDAGPEAICYRADLFEQAGLPTDREEVAKLLEGDWETYFEVGRQFTEATDIPWFDGALGTYNGMVQQLEFPYENEDGTVKPLPDNAEVKAIYDQLAEYKDISAGLGQWSEDWTAGFQNDGFATMLCPGWMTGVIEGNAAGVEGWDIADVFPGGGGNWGGSYLLVPSQTEYPDEARELAAWLTAPEQAIGAFEAVGAFPSQVEALEDEALLSQTNEFFNDAPMGEIFANRAAAIEVQPFQGEHFFVYNTVVADAITRWDVDGTDAAESWEQALSAYGELGLE